MFHAYPALLITKLYAPARRSGQIARPALYAQLNQGAGRRLILVAAAAGFGKTTLIAEWCTTRAEAVCWLALDEGDNDLARFLAYVVAALQTHEPTLGQELLAALQSPQPPQAEVALTILLNQVATLNKPLFLILDDYHTITNTAVHSALLFLLEHAPPMLTVILLTRTDPPLPLARLRANGALLEIRAAALRFSPAEITQFLQGSFGLQLSAAAITALAQRTEGWIVGLQLAALALQHTADDSEAFIREFSGSHRFVLEYLLEEVLAQQPAEVRAFLLHTAVLSRFTAVLCDAVTQATNGRAMLDYLERHNLFLVPLDQTQGWYRYHHLFADLLHARLLAEGTLTPTELYQRASHWHTTQGTPEEAVQYALLAQDYAAAARLMLSPKLTLTKRGEVHTLLAWYRQLPESVIAEYPELCLQFVLACVLNGRWQEAEMLLRTLEGVELAALSDEALLLSYWLAVGRQDVPQLQTIVAQIASAPHLNANTRLILALLVSLSGDFATACQWMQAAHETAIHQKDEALALTALLQLCRLQVFAGHLQQAHRLSLAALAQVQALGAVALPTASFAHVTLGRVFVEWHELEQAEHHLQQAIALSEKSGFVTGMLSSATMMLAEVAQARGDAKMALQLAETALAHAQRYDPPAEAVWLRAYQARLWLGQGRREVETWLALQLPAGASWFYPPAVQQVTQARVWLTLRKFDEVIALLTRLLATSRDLFTVEAWCTLAQARAFQGDHVHALLALEQALLLAEPENRMQVFIELNMGKLLTRWLETHPDHDFARRVLALLPDEAPNNPLNERELAVLRLIVAGLSNEEIAAHLTLALSTVKWYINVIYGKLYVKTRAQAVARAHELHLLR